MGIATAFEVKDLKTIDDYDSFDNNGYSKYRTNSNRYFLVEKIVKLDDDFIDEWFNNNTKMKTTAYPVGDNIYYFGDDEFKFYGYHEVVELDGEYYMVNIYQDSKLSPGEQTQYLKDLQEFNKANNLKPIAV